MDYRRALDALRARLEHTSLYPEFLTLEYQLGANLDREKNGSTETIRSERSEIVARLNALALETLGITFNDLLFGRVSTVQLSQAIVTLLATELGIPRPPFPVPPPVKTRSQHLPFESLSWGQFELLCAAFVQAQPNVRDVHLYGVGGDFQKGIDVVATQVRDGRPETWVYQCKHVKHFTPKELEAALDRISYTAQFVVMMLSCKARASLRDVVALRTNTFLWDSTDIARKLKLYPLLVEDFFGDAWRKDFSGGEGLKN